MSDTLTQQYAFKKGDSLDAIAKKHGLKDQQVIWKLPDNKAIVSKRGKPDQLRPGDILVIPPSEKELKEAQSKIQKALDALDAEITRTTKKGADIDKLMRDVQASMLSCIKSLEQNKVQVTNMGNAADAVAMITQLGVNLGGLAKKASEGAELTGKALEKANKELLGDAKSIAASPVQTATVKSLETCSGSTNTAVIFVAALAKSYDEMTSPSFWANTAVQLINGKSWSDAVTTNVGDDLDRQARTVRAQTVEQLKSLADHKQKIVAHLGDLQTQRKRGEAALKALQ